MPVRPIYLGYGSTKACFAAADAGSAGLLSISYIIYFLLLSIFAVKRLTMTTISLTELQLVKMLVRTICVPGV